MLFMAAWFVSYLALIHLPISFRRLGGVQFPMGALAAFALTAFVAPPVVARLSRWPRLVGWRRGLGAAPVGAAVLAIGCVALPFELAGPQRIVDLEWGALRAEKYPAWVRKSEREAYEALERIRDGRPVVFCSYAMGGLVPPWTGHRTYIGHYALTIDAKRKEEETVRFFSGDSADDPWRVALLARMGATHLLYTAHERGLGAFDPETRPWLREIFRAGGDGAGRAVVYAVELSASPTP